MCVCVCERLWSHQWNQKSSVQFLLLLRKKRGCAKRVKRCMKTRHESESNFVVICY